MKLLAPVIGRVYESRRKIQAMEHILERERPDLYQAYKAEIEALNDNAAKELESLLTGLRKI
jgi:MoxR-like ATPase